MTIKEAIKLLNALADQIGDDSPVFFDCEFCGKASHQTLL